MANLQGVATLKDKQMEFYVPMAIFWYTYDETHSQSIDKHAAVVPGSFSFISALINRKIDICSFVVTVLVLRHRMHIRGVRLVMLITCFVQYGRRKVSFEP